MATDRLVVIVLLLVGLALVIVWATNQRTDRPRVFRTHEWRIANEAPRQVPDRRPVWRAPEFSQPATKGIGGRRRA